MHRLDRRTFLALASTPLFAALLEACGGSDASRPVTKVSQTHSDLARISPPATEAPPAALALNEFGADLYRQLATTDPIGNIVMSPASIAVALTMTSIGARGATLDEMVATLHIDDPVGIHRSMNALMTQLAALGHDDVELSMANSLWAQADMTFQAAFLDRLATEYGTGVELVDYRSDAESARVAINGWVSDETRARIPELLSPGMLSDATRFVLVNAIYLNAAWEKTFDANLTADASFTTAAGDEVQVPTMTMTTQLGYTTGDGWQAVELPYADSSLAMLIIVPEPGFLQLFEEIFLITDSAPYLEPQQVQLSLPRFDIGSTFSLADQLEVLGMATAFTDQADFTGITTDEPLQLSAVVHQANLTVTEKGTEAAAATAVIGVATSAPAGDPVTLVIDRPFVFALRDRATEVILFLGRVADPRG